MVNWSRKALVVEIGRLVGVPARSDTSDLVRHTDMNATLPLILLHTPADRNGMHTSPRTYEHTVTSTICRPTHTLRDTSHTHTRTHIHKPPHSSPLHTNNLQAYTHTQIIFSHTHTHTMPTDLLGPIHTIANRRRDSKDEHFDERVRSLFRL